MVERAVYEQQHRQPERCGHYEIPSLTKHFVGGHIYLLLTLITEEVVV
tara:strand:- start:958 stop:1101 length:144 start_codon:yes stop_codon:yes gene_type:complete